MAREVLQKRRLIFSLACVGNSASGKKVASSFVREDTAVSTSNVGFVFIAGTLFSE